MSNIAITGALQMQLGGCQPTRNCCRESPPPNSCLALPCQPCPSPRAAALVSPYVLYTAAPAPDTAAPLAASLLAVDGLKRWPLILIISHNCAVNLISIMVF